MTDEGAWHSPLRKALRFSVLFVADTFGVLVNVSLIALVRWWMGHLGEIRLFDWVPLAYILDAMEAAILLAFVIHAVGAAIYEVRGKPW